ncbi:MULTISPECIES: phage/plasmid primase, P4 family [unclassified Oceanobacillus]|uniref:phage/plasmid primase, P4 family n=1 Tax=unclassified Oceanobacillus TaxID=2630292 RepID=UPI001BE749AB|nr:MULTISPECIES: phage/plasmid primase, P4 family [unclassified Oceanobacillus]MBT2600904.1 DNA primase [Oceanobacillus sp. ISL-74]MBT2653435.1 DNA primase [Oceanobacillus sp. ISL-73]
MYEAIPYELKELKQWCCFKLQQRNGKTTKIPVDANTGGHGKSNDESTWSSFDTALGAINKFNCDGLGFFFKPPYYGIDIDDIQSDIERYRNEDHDNNIVSEFIDIMESYAEVSPSGNGIHIIAKGDLPEGGRRKGNIEMYDSGRFFTMTGNHIGGYNHIIEDEMGKVNYLHHKYIATQEVAATKDYSLSEGNVLSVDEIIKVASNSKNGMRFKLFLDGGWEQFYNSQSEADMAFSNDLAFWTACDYNKMDDIFRSSSLYRDKWDRKQSNSTYGEITLNKAISECTNVFSPQSSNDDFNLYVAEFDTKKIEKKYYSYDDTGNAERFTNLYKDSVRYSYIRKNWYYYNDKTWQLDQEGKVKSLVDEILIRMKQEPVFVADDVDEEEARKNLTKHIKYSRGSNGKTNMLKESQHLLPIQPDEFDKDKHLFNVQNGYLDLETGKLHDHDRSKLFTKISSIEFTDKIDCPLWVDFLHQIFDGDQQLIDYLQRAVGYSLSGSTEEQMMFILYGNGRNGKSVFLDIITEMMGNYTTNIQPQTIMVKPQAGTANSDIARLQGARLVTTTEPNDGMRFDEGLVKQITGGDKVTARFLYGDEFDYYPEFKLWMATNHKPIIRGTDDGIWRRMAIIPFTVQIPENKVDKQLKYKLRRELKAILNWAVEGYQEWKRIGLSEPQTIKDQRKEYRTEMDAVELFIDECCYRKTGEREKANDLYKVYRDWAKNNGQYMMNSTKFGKEMGNKFQKIRSNGSYYVGLQLRPEFGAHGFQLNLN